MDCSVCFEAITNETGKSVLSCSHTFHITCLIKWFDTQIGNELSESCPCCRHAANDTEKMPIYMADSSSESSESSEDEELTHEELMIMASVERAAHKFRNLKVSLSKDALEDYAATCISSTMKGYWARKNFIRYRSSQQTVSSLKRVILRESWTIAIEQLRQGWLLKALIAGSSSSAAELSISVMDYVERATTIQTCWRSFLLKKEQKAQQKAQQNCWMQAGIKSMSTKALLAFLAGRSIIHKSCIEKNDLLAVALQAISV